MPFQPTTISLNARFATKWYRTGTVLVLISFDCIRNKRVKSVSIVTDHSHAPEILQGKKVSHYIPNRFLIVHLSIESIKTGMYVFTRARNRSNAHLRIVHMHSVHLVTCINICDVIIQRPPTFDSMCVSSAVEHLNGIMIWKVSINFVGKIDLIWSIEKLQFHSNLGHELTHKKNEEGVGYTCEFCSKRFVRKVKSMKLHSISNSNQFRFYLIV